MSDAGKILLGTSGNPLTAADGGIVIADRLYPYVLTGDLTVSHWYRRLVSSTWPPTADVNVWDENWLTTASGAMAKRYVLTDICKQGATQAVHKMVLSNLKYKNYSALEVPFSRISLIKFQFMAFEYSSGDDDEVVYFRGHYSIGDQSDPSGAEEVWERSGWSEFVTDGGLDVGTGDTETFTVDVTPAQIEDGEIIIWLASFFDVYTPPSPAVAFNRDISLGLYGATTGRITYNLAT